MRISLKIIFSMLLLGATLAHGRDTDEPLDIVFPIVSETPVQSRYFLSLLRQSLEAIEYPHIIEPLKMPQVRAKDLLSDGTITVFWMLESAKRNSEFQKIDIQLTNGLIGKRVFFIRPRDQARFDGIKTLEDFIAKGFSAALGESWYDVKVWKHNQLAFKTYRWNWNVIYEDLLTNHEIDYFPRGINEILTESDRHPSLLIEEHLLLEYKRDFVFYLGDFPESHRVARIITRALTSAEQSGLKEQVIQEFWGNKLKQLNYSNRRVIKLETPP